MVSDSFLFWRGVQGVAPVAVSMSVRRRGLSLPQYNFFPLESMSHIVSICPVDSNVLKGAGRFLIEDLLCEEDKQWAIWVVPFTFLLIDSENDHDLVLADTNKLLDRANTTSRQFAQQDHSFDIVVFQELDIGTHLSDLTNVDHHQVVHYDRRVGIQNKAKKEGRLSAMAR